MAPVIRAEELRQHGQSQGAENARGAPLPAMPQTAQGAQPEKERPVNVLVAPVDQRVEKGQVKGELAHQRKGQHPPGVLPEAVGVQEALHQQEAVEGERQPPGPPQAEIQREQRLGNGPRREKTPASRQDAPRWSSSILQRASRLRAVPLNAGRCVWGTTINNPPKECGFDFLLQESPYFLWKFPLGCLTKAGRDSTLKKKIELQQEQDEKDSQKIGRLRTSNGKEALRYDAVFL